MALTLAGNAALRRDCGANPTRFGMGSERLGLGKDAGLVEGRAADGVAVGSSPIHGDGAFTRQQVKAGDVICRMVLGDEVTYTARKVNSSIDPNLEPRVRSGDLVLTAQRDIPPGGELLGNYPYPKA